MATRRARFKRVRTEIDSGVLAELRRPIERLIRTVDGAGITYQLSRMLWDPDLTDAQRLDLARSQDLVSFGGWILDVQLAWLSFRKAVKKVEAETWLRRQLEGLGAAERKS